MRKSLIFVLLPLLAIAVGLFVYRSRCAQDRPRRMSLRALQDFQQTLQAAKADALLAAVAVPAALKDRTPAEQVEFVSKALRDEVSPEGIAALRAKAVFGPLKDIFPVEGAKWAQQAGVAVSDCVAFKAEKNGIRAEVAIATNGPQYRIVRLNNVKQLGM